MFKEIFIMFLDFYFFIFFVLDLVPHSGIRSGCRKKPGSVPSEFN
jgi:hypothetical protein